MRKTGPGIVWVIAGDQWIEPRGIEELAELLGVTPATVRRWARGDPIPPTVKLALRARVIGELLHDDWKGWRVDPDGKLWAPNGYGFRPAELAHFQLLFATNRALRLRIAELERKGPAASPRVQHDDAVRYHPKRSEGTGG